MQYVLAIWQREIKSYFVSPIAYVVLTIFLVLAGLFFYGNLTEVVQFTMMQAQLGQGGQPIDVPAYVAQSLFKTFTVILLFLIPMLTMGLFAEEKKRGTIELLLTTPVGTSQALLGKYLASLTFLLILLVASMVTVSPLFVFGQPDWKPMLAGYLGLFLYGAALLALGLFISTLTENQIVAVIVTFGASLVLWLVNVFGTVFGGSSSGPAREVVDYLSVINHLDDFLKGVIDTSHIIYYVTFSFVGLFLAYRSLESMRWKG
ncbi:MAG: ABC transporter permease subunit [Acidobacteriota bacterium]|jgi:ABC-2 type transport system permease protein|nr:ABC transporter permease subunit [Acidobacteriota bacterium]